MKFAKDPELLEEMQKIFRQNRKRYWTAFKEGVREGFWDGVVQGFRIFIFQKPHTWHLIGLLLAFLYFSEEGLAVLTVCFLSLSGLIWWIRSAFGGECE